MKRLSRASLSLRLYTSCIAYIKAAAWMAYSFNMTFRDDELEDLTFLLSKKICNIEDLETDPMSVVFIDSFARDNRGLTQQYLRAIMAQHLRLVYITDIALNSPTSSNIFEELKSYPKSEIINIPNKHRLYGIKRAQYIYNRITEARPGKVFMHLEPNAVEAIIALHALPKSIERYQINLTDHTFWLGATALDYTLEFRAYGLKVSEQERKLDKSKLLLCPYYPIISNNPFRGFQFDTKNRCLVFSGGTSYKYVDEKHTFFVMMKRILDENPRVIWVHAGDDMEGIRQMILSVMEESYLKRIYLIGSRDDIGEVFRHIDIYINSYPMGGGLMNLYAARFAKPVVSLMKDVYTSANQIIGQLRDVSVDYSTIDEICIELHHLIADVEYRRSQGETLKESTIDANLFNELFAQLCATKANVLPIPDTLREVHLPTSFSMYDCRNSIVGLITWRGLFVPYCQIKALLYYPNKIISVVIRYLKK